MSKSPTSTALSALSRSKSSKSNTVAAANIVAPLATDGTTAAVAAVTNGTPAIDYVALYRQYCAEEGCKANSAFVRYIQDRGGHFSLERLNLGHNYLGSKGLRPVLRMIDLCQTIVAINLEDNGIDNGAVADLCVVLERHVSCASLNLRRNPISVVGGKRLLQLAETNPRMMEILMDGTDIFEGLKERIQMALQHNAAMALGNGPQMEANKYASTTNGSRLPSSDAFNNKNTRRSANLGKTTTVGSGGAKTLPQGRASASGNRKLVASTLPPPPKATLQLINSLNGTLSNTAPDDLLANSHSTYHHGSNASPAHGGKQAATLDSSALISREASVRTINTAASRTPTRPATATTSLAAAPVLPTAVGNMNARLGWQEAALSKAQPRPPPPAVASAAVAAAKTSKALPVNKAVDLKALFAERARLHTEINRGEASRRAYTAREELQALERYGRPVPGCEDSSSTPTNGGVHQTYMGALPTPNDMTNSSAAATAMNTKTFPLLPPLQDGSNAASTTTSNTVTLGGGALGSLISNGNNRLRSAGSGTQRPSTSSSVKTHSDSEVIIGATPLPPPSTTVKGDAATDNNTNDKPTTIFSPTASAVASTPPPTESGALGVPPPSSQDAVRPLAHTIEDVLSSSRMMLLTTEEQFTTLFDQGCRMYVSRNLDAAYMAWNEAMRLAISEGQREWMAVVASNLQRLSYELLVEEGASHLEHGALEKAGETFNLALEVAVKAKNAAWERDMRLAKQNVQKALFHRCHEAALLLFSRAQEGMRKHNSNTSNLHNNTVGNPNSADPDSTHCNDNDDNEVTEDDHFVLPGTEEIVRHTRAFVREWSCLLLLKEAIGLWVEGTRVVSRLSEVAAAPLKENITEALNLVASFIVQRHFNDTTPTGLLWFGTDAYLYHECVLLSDLWYDLVADSEQSLHHPLLSAVCAAQLGELYVATFQLPQALVQLDKLVRYGHLHKSPVLEATGLTLCGRVHLQRANHALAEAALEAALGLWAALQSDSDVKQLISGGNNGNYGGPSLVHGLAPMDTSATTVNNTNTSDTTNTTSSIGNDAIALTSTMDSDGARSGSSAIATGGGLCFRIESHLPPDAIAVLSSACCHYKVCLLLQTYRYRDALEALEYGLNMAYADTLQQKLGRNYHLNPSLDEIAAIAGMLQTSLVFYTLTSRYDWSVSQNAYQVEESLCMWVLAESREMRFVEVNLTSNFKSSMQDLLDSLRQYLCVEPEMAMQSEIITELPSRSWQEPLRVLYQACIYPIIGYVRAADPQLLFGDGVITVVPTGLLWLVPFHALLNVKAGDRYLVEEVAIQLAFSATQAAFASLSAARVQHRDLHHEVVAVQTDLDTSDVADSIFYTAFPLNADRSSREGEVVAAMLRAGQAQVAERQLKKATAAAAATMSPSTAASTSSTVGGAVKKSNNSGLLFRGTPTTATSVFRHKVEVAENVEALREVLPRARTLHIATATTSANVPSHVRPLLEEQRGRQRAENEGGILMSAASPMGDIGIIRAAEIAHMELFAEHVILTNTNMSIGHVRGIRDDVLGLVRSFFGSGVPCVIAGQWCTPDMEPLELFQRFYTLWCRPAATSADASLRTVTQSNSGPRTSESCGSVSTSEGAARGESFHAGNPLVPHYEPQQQGAHASSSNSGSLGGGNLSDTNGNAGSHYGTANADTLEEECEVVRHRALLLAQSIRRLLTEEPAMRYRPRVWAGYYCIGTGW